VSYGIAAPEPIGKVTVGEVRYTDIGTKCRPPWTRGRRRLRARRRRVQAANFLGRDLPLIANSLAMNPGRRSSRPLPPYERLSGKIFPPDALRLFASDMLGQAARQKR
jgi:hypothetical protein